MKKLQGPKVLIVDIETKPIIAQVWGLFKQNIGLEQIQEDWNIISFSAKWLDDPPEKMIYMDLRGKKITNDKPMLKVLWKLLDEADIVVGQNSKSFDTKKINSRFLFHGLPPPASYRHIDILLINQKHFAHTSNKLAWISEKFNKKFKKLKHKEFPGHEMWTECIKGNIAAWKAMKDYNQHDVLATEEMYRTVMPWDNTVNFAVYSDSLTPICHCGSKVFKPMDKLYYTDAGKYKRYRCVKCGTEVRSKENLLNAQERKSIRTRTNRS